MHVQTERMHGFSFLLNAPTGQQQVTNPRMKLSGIYVSCEQGIAQSIRMY
jgi:hypothetical protein